MDVASAKARALSCGQRLDLGLLLIGQRELRLDFVAGPRPHAFSLQTEFTQAGPLFGLEEGLDRLVRFLGTLFAFLPDLIKLLGTFFFAQLLEFFTVKATGPPCSTHRFHDLGELRFLFVGHPQFLLDLFNPEQSSCTDVPTLHTPASSATSSGPLSLGERGSCEQ